MTSTQTTRLACVVSGMDGRLAAGRLQPQRQRPAASPLPQGPAPARLVPLGRTRAVVCAAEASQAVAQLGELRLELPTADVQSAVQLASVNSGKGVAIVVAAVAAGSEAAAAGVRPGQQVLEVSDPIRFADSWVLNERASLRYVRQCIAMRRAETLLLRLTAQPIPEYLEMKQQAAAAAAAAAAEAKAAAAAAAAQPDDAAASGASIDDEPADLLTAVVQAAQAEASGAAPAGAGAAAAGTSSSASATAEAEVATKPGTIAEKLEQQYQRQQQYEDQQLSGLLEEQRQLSALQRRLKRRKEYFEQQSQRNDGPFFATVAAFIVLPPAVILGIAAASGYLDQLDMFGGYVR